MVVSIAIYAFVTSQILNMNCRNEAKSIKTKVLQMSFVCILEFYLKFHVWNKCNNYKDLDNFSVSSIERKLLIFPFYKSTLTSRVLYLKNDTETAMYHISRI